MYCFINPNREYLHKNGKIVLFETGEEANLFMNYFLQYAIQRLQSEGRGIEAMSAPMVLSQFQLIPVSFDIETIECGVVFCKDLRKQ